MKNINENIALVFHGFLNLTNLEKLKLVEEMNGYFDSMNRESIRAEHELKFKELKFDKPCKCCDK